MSEILKHGGKAETYEEFVDKFKSKLTTDDCFTPPPVFDAVLNFAVKEFGVNPDTVVRPFWPGKDYQAEDYTGRVVIDNPPFSILSKIIRWYEEHGVKYLLFAPSLTLFGLRNAADLLFLVCFADVTYSNGAVVRTSFVTNMGDPGMWTCKELHDAVEQASDAAKAANSVTLPKYNMPSNVWSAATIGRIAKRVDIRIPSDQYVFVRTLDSMKKDKKGIFGGGFMFSDLWAEKLDEARRQADEARQITWELSDRERAIIEELNNKST